MSKRFVINEKNIYINETVIQINSREDINHIKALRYNTGDVININDDMVLISSIKTNILLGKVLNKKEKSGEPKIFITLIQSYLKSDKTEFVLQKAVELGIKEFIPVISENTVVKIESKDKLKKKERLEKIKNEAIMQCGRTDTVNVLDIVNIKDIDYSKYSYVILCYEEETLSLPKVLDLIKQKINNELTIAVIIGPEGGFSKSEIEFIKQSSKNVKTVVFGERILRSETAAVYVLSILDYELNN